MHQRTVLIIATCIALIGVFGGLAWVWYRARPIPEASGPPLEPPSESVPVESLHSEPSAEDRPGETPRSLREFIAKVFDGSGIPRPPVEMPKPPPRFVPAEITDSDPPPDDRPAAARRNQAEFIANIFADIGVSYPPVEIYFRAFKTERLLELWARDRSSPQLSLVYTFPLTGISGTPGPKRREGDGQIPEGFYVINRFNSKSSYLLSLGLNYPNASDAIRSDPDEPGSDIFIHGGDLTIGCLAVGDPAIQAIYTIASDAGAAGQGGIPVHIFPSRWEEGSWSKPAMRAAQDDPALDSFWAELAPAFQFFETHQVVPSVTVTSDGAYQVAR